jgi:hypothetical protein
LAKEDRSEIEAALAEIEKLKVHINSMSISMLELIGMFKEFSTALHVPADGSGFDMDKFRKYVAEMKDGGNGQRVGAVPLRPLDSVIEEEGTGTLLQ